MGCGSGRAWGMGWGGWVCVCGGGGEGCKLRFLTFSHICLGTSFCFRPNVISDFHTHTHTHTHTHARAHARTHA